MKNDFLDLFRQTPPESSSASRPSPKAWRKLERKLDGYDRWRKLMERYAVVMVYLILLLVVLLVPVIITLILRDQQQALSRTPKAVIEVLHEKDSIPGVRAILEKGAQKNKQE